MFDFNKVLNIDVSAKVEKKKTGTATLTYLSWEWAWAEFVKIYPTATYKVLKNKETMMPYFSSDAGVMVYTEVTVDNLTHEMWLPVMDGANNAMKSEAYEYSTKFGKKPVAAFDMFDVNKTIMRCLVKNLAMFGLGLYIYAGEDLPEEAQEAAQKEKAAKAVESLKANQPEPPKNYAEARDFITDWINKKPRTHEEINDAVQRLYKSFPESSTEIAFDFSQFTNPKEQ
jgi:hypothetical protein